MSIKDSVSKVTAPIIERYEAHKETVEQLEDLVPDISETVRHTQDAFEAAKAKFGKVDKIVSKMTVGSHALTVSKTIGVVANIISLPSQINGSIREVRAALRSGSREEVQKALVSVEGSMVAVQRAVDAVIDTTGLIAKSAKALATRGSRFVPNAASSSLLKTGALATGGGKWISRFVPYLNYAMATSDVAAAAAIHTDPKASLGKKLAAYITAIGSVVAATNYPIVSSAAAAVSTASYIVGSFL